MKKSIFFAGAAFAASIFAGCRPELSQQPLGAKEQQWRDFIKNDYPSWQAPESWPTDARIDDAYTASELAEIDARNAAAAPVPADSYEPLDMGDFDEAVVVDSGAGEVVEMIIAEEPPAETAETVTYKVQKGDTLSAISLRFYGSAGQWKKILDANPALNGNPNKIRVGQSLTIPDPVREYWAGRWPKEGIFSTAPLRLFWRSRAPSSAISPARRSCLACG